MDERDIDNRFKELLRTADVDDLTRYAECLARVIMDGANSSPPYREKIAYPEQIARNIDDTD